MRSSFALAVMVVTTSAFAGSVVEVQVGSARVIEGRLVSVDRRDVLQATALGERQVLLVGKAPGTATVVIASEWAAVSRKVKVVAFDAARELAEVRQLMPPNEGLLVGFDGRCLWAECPACSDAERTKVETVLALYPCVLSRDPISPGKPVTEVLEGVRAVLGEAPTETPDLTLEVRGGKVVLWGRVRTPEDTRRVDRAKAAFPELVVHVVGP